MKDRIVKVLSFPGQLVKEDGRGLNFWGTGQGGGSSNRKHIDLKSDLKRNKGGKRKQNKTYQQHKKQWRR